MFDCLRVNIARLQYKFTCSPRCNLQQVSPCLVVTAVLIIVLPNYGHIAPNCIISSISCRSDGTFATDDFEIRLRKYLPRDVCNQLHQLSGAVGVLSNTLNRPTDSFPRCSIFRL